MGDQRFGRRRLVMVLAVLVWTCIRPAVTGEPLPKTPGPTDSKGVGGVSRFSPLSDAGGNAGLFVGVNEFREDSSLSPLRFAVNDAIAIAHLFVVEIRLIPPDRAVLLIGGKPEGDTAVQQLEELKSKGVRLDEPLKVRFFKHLSDSTQRAEDLLVLSFSAHGFEESGKVYVMPIDGVRASLSDTAINLDSVERKLQQSKASKRLLLLDACRENPLRDGKGLGTMSEHFRKALARATGQAILASCDVDQVSFEDPQSRHGVFTHYLIEALRGAAESDTEGFIRLHGVLTYVSQEVEKWCTRNNRTRQQPCFKGPEKARQIPLAMDPDVASKLNARLQRLRTLAVDGEIPATWAEEADRLLKGRINTDAEAKLTRLYTDLADGKIDLETARIAIEAMKKTPLPPPPPPPDTVHAIESPKLSDRSGLQVIHSQRLPSLRLVLVLAPPDGRARVGYNLGKDDEKLEFDAELSHNFYLSETEITYGQFRAVMGEAAVAQPFSMRADNYPVTNVSLQDALKFCEKLGELDGATYRLPTEFEWEYACRAGALGVFGDGIMPADLKDFAVWNRKVEPVGPHSGRKPNRFGLYDMHGNVAELTCSPHLPYPHSPAPASIFRGTDYIVVRGGSHVDSDENCLRASIRVPFHRDARAPHVGFRILRTID